MSAKLIAYRGASIFDGERRYEDHALIVQGARVHSIVPDANRPHTAENIDLDGGTLAPGYVDLQVNGGDGIMFNDDPSVGTLRRMVDAHARLGATSILPTLITDTPDRTHAAIAAVHQAIAENVPGIIGLHLEGPHLSILRKGAHDPDLIRPMNAGDLAVLVDAAKQLPCLKITVAPEVVTQDQIRTLNEAGAVVSLGHSNADFNTCALAVKAGASCVTHLFNAMSQIGNREPGLVGAALGLGAVSAGLIADGIHVHPQTIATALRAKAGPGRLFLVSDSMATAGSDITGFTLNGRPIRRGNGHLTLEDGTLAGADLDLTTAIRVLTKDVDHGFVDALRMATSLPARVIRQPHAVGRLATGMPADMIRLSETTQLIDVWRAGRLMA
ncbi:MAG: N-acetylglucosamine-6-phosphate deacetylase [Geminicoccaceae bacterium]